MASSKSQIAVAQSARLPGRAAVAKAKRVVVKIGSRTLASHADVYGRLAASAKAAHAAGRSLVLL